MDVDPLAVAGLVTREVRTGRRDGRPTRIAVARRTYPAAPTDVWSALTDPERLPRWFLPVHGDLTVGGRFRTEGNAGGVIEQCDAPHTLAVTWEMGPVVSWLRLALEPEGSGTALELTHEAPVDPEFWATFGPGAVGVGWDLALFGLGLHLETGAAVAADFADFGLTPDGVRFTRTAATGWADAAAADGDDPRAAREAGDRTFAFYTTAPDQAESPEAADAGTGGA